MALTAAEKDARLFDRIERNTGRLLILKDIRTLRRAERILHRWCELECGAGNNYASWAIERDPETNIPYMVTYPHKGEVQKHRIPDREKGALKRVNEICSHYGLQYYYQTDPRGCALYVAHSDWPRLTEFNYTNGVIIC